jgi:BirA family biotin operon repressor/biotin-[acetyl-CoA-carboxylase] ligase
MDRSERPADAALAASDVWNLDTRRLGRQVLVYERVASTNDVALAAGGEGVVVLADEQSAGRGQYGRSWLAPPRSSVLLSVVLTPPPPLRRPAVLTAWAAVAVCAVVEDVVGTPPRIKWPNDVLLEGRKVCGILIEQEQSGTRPPATVAGIGLNVAQSAADLLAAGLPDAISLCQSTVRPLRTHSVARQLIRQLDDDYDRLCCGDLALLEERWRRHLGLLGRTVRADCRGGTYCGRLLELGFGGVELERAGAAPLLLQPEVVLHLEAFD